MSTRERSLGILLIKGDGRVGVAALENVGHRDKFLLRALLEILLEIFLTGWVDD